MLQINKTFLIIGSLLVLLAVALAPFHHHDDGGGHQQCALCRLGDFFNALIALSVFLFLFRPLRQGSFIPAAKDRIRSLYLTSRLRDRAPPFSGF